MKSMKEGRTFITNGPAAFLTVDDQMPGDTVHTEPGKKLSVTVSWTSHYAIQRVEIIWNGSVVAAQPFPEGATEGQLEVGVEASSDGWVAARISSTTRDSFFQPIYAHTSPVYVVTGRRGMEGQKAARRFDRSIEQALEGANRRGRFQPRKQQEEVLELFREGQCVSRRLLGP